MDDDELRLLERNRLILAFLWGNMSNSMLKIAEMVVNTRLPYKDDGGLNFEKLFAPDINPRRFHNLFRMEQSTFRALVNRLSRFMKRDQRNTTFEERIGATLIYFAHPMTQTGFQELLQRSGSYISATIHEVVEAMYSALSFSQYSAPNSTDEHYAFHRFQGVVGSLDGTHIPVTQPANGGAAYRDRFGEISQNVLVVVNLEAKACCVMTGGEGCGSDQTLLDCARENGLRIPPGCFLLGDAGFSLTTSVLTPYRGVRYHLNEFGPSSSSAPRNMKELFNLRHARLRAAVERFFGMLKEKFPILRVGIPFPYVLRSNNYRFFFMFIL
jgi:hypothetical protein